MDKMEGGCARASGAHSMSPRTSTPSLPLPVDLPSSPTPLPPLPNVPAVVAQLLLEFPGVVNPSKQLPSAVKHHTKTVRPLLASRFHRLEGAKLQAAWAEFKQMEKDSIVHHSTSPWASPLHMVPKKDGSWQPCSDFRRRNQVTEPDLYPLPNIINFADQLSGCTVFSKIDLRKGY